jgi:hypothetical protein
MRSLHFCRCALGIYVAAEILAGCGGSQPSVGSPGAMPQGPAAMNLTPLSTSRLLAMTVPHYVSHSHHTDHGRSWMSAGAKNIKKLLYVSDQSTNDVYVYDYGNGKRVGTLTGFAEPYGQCVDREGDVFVSDFDNGTTFEYAHGGTAPINAYSTDGYAIGCSVDRQGDVAVTDFNSSNGPGQICIWTQGSGPSTCYSNGGSCFFLWPAGYENDGNLYTETQDYDVCELPRGSSNMKIVGSSNLNFFPGSVMWDGKYVALTDQEYLGEDETAIWQMSEDASGNLIEVGVTVLLDDCDSDYADILQPFILGRKNTPTNKIQGTAVVGSNLWCIQEGYGKVNYWQYTAGGNPTSSLEHPPAEPYGQSVSIAP